MGGFAQSKDELDAKTDAIMNEVAPTGMPPLGNEEELAFWLKAVKKSVVGGSPQAQRLYADYLKLISKEKETNGFEFAPEDYLRVARKVLNRLRENYQQGGGDCPVCGRPRLLHSEIREDTGQGEAKGSPIPLVPIPAGTPASSFASQENNNSES